MTAISLILATTLSLAPNAAGVGEPSRIDVDCELRGALERALRKAEPMAPVDLYLNGVCRGNYRIETDGITLRAGSPGAGLAAPVGDRLAPAVLEVVNASVALRGLTVEGGEIGLWVHGDDGELLLVDMNVDGQSAIGTYAFDGATLRLFDTVVRGGDAAVVVDQGSRINVQGATISGAQVGVLLADRSGGALNDAVIEDCGDTGLAVTRRSDLNVLRGSFRENGSVHVLATDRSDVTLLFEVGVGAPDDSTRVALSVGREATIASYTTSMIHGDVSALVGGSIRFGNATVDGDLVAQQFATIHARTVEVDGVAFCSDGADIYCRNTTTDGSIGCPSATCGDEPATAPAPTTAAPANEGVSALERARRLRPRP